MDKQIQELRFKGTILDPTTPTEVRTPVAELKKRRALEDKADAILRANPANPEPKQYPRKSLEERASESVKARSKILERRKHSLDNATPENRKLKLKLYKRAAKRLGKSIERDRVRAERRIMRESLHRPTSTNGESRG